MRKIWAVLATSVFLPVPAGAETAVAVINDPDGFTNVRSEPRPDVVVVDKIVDGQRFITTGGSEDWWEVWSPAGKRGYIHKSRLKVMEGEPFPRMSFARADVVKAASDVPEFQEHAKDYPKLVLAAVGGSVPELKKFYEAPRTLSLDGAGAEIHASLMWELFHVVGDKQFAEFLGDADSSLVRDIATDFRSGLSAYPIDKPDEYLALHFPRTWKVLGAVDLDASVEETTGSR